MLKTYITDKLKWLPEPLRQFVGLASIIIFVILSFSVLNNIYGEGDELVEKMKSE